MKLEEALNQIDRLADEDVVFARRPWRLDAEALIGRLDKNMGVPKSVSDQNLEYFIDIPVAKEVLVVFDPKIPSEQERNDLILYYAEHDAYPDWVYQI